ncbi:MAG: hypothetical protein ACK4GT_15135, partial [Pararhodobacter sp.]
YPEPGGAQLMPPPDRLELLANQSVLTGLDFVYVHESQITLDLYFLVDPASLAVPMAGTIGVPQVIIHRTAGDGSDRFPITALSWPIVSGRQVLRIELPFPGGFELYDLRLDDTRIDPRFAVMPFSFKANCDSGLDCRPDPRCCGPEGRIDLRVDTTARDFQGLRAALIDFAAERWPDWKDRLEADVGVMMVELVAALGDEFAWTGDQIAHELRFDTARERRSLRHFARLVDYEPDDGASAAGWLAVRCSAGQSGTLAAGSRVEAPSDSGTVVVFEIGNGLSDTLAGRVFPVDAAANAFTAYVWDEDMPPGLPGEVGPLWPPGRLVPESCLPRGAVELWIEGNHAANLPLTDIPADPAALPGRWVLLRTDPADPAMPARRHVVRLTGIADAVDALNGNAPLTRLRWEAAQALPVDFDLSSLTVEGNVVPITAGRTLPEPEPGQPRTGLRFATGDQPAGETELPRSVERGAGDGATRHFFTLPESDTDPLTRFGPAGAASRAEIALTEIEWNAGLADWAAVRDWQHRLSFLGTNASLPTDTHFTLDDILFHPIVRHWRDPADYLGRDDPGGPPRFEPGRLVHYDVDIGSGATIRFGTGEFGRLPAEGTAFACHYRLGGGRQGNVAMDSVTGFPDAPAFVEEIYNPLPTSGGRDPETADSLRRLAPALYRTLTFRAVTEPDYVEAAERLAWVDHGGARFRDTGSWLAVFATADPVGLDELPDSLARGLHDHLDRFRQAGRDLRIRAPHYANIDLDITVCVTRGYFRGDVKGRVLRALFGDCDHAGFLSPDNFTFGAPLYRSQLEAAIQSVQGVRAVEQVLIRRRGVFDWKRLTGPYAPADPTEIIRIANDPAHPEWGFVILEMEGGS